MAISRITMDLIIGVYHNFYERCEDILTDPKNPFKFTDVDYFLRRVEKREPLGNLHPLLRNAAIASCQDFKLTPDEIEDFLDGMERKFYVK